MLATIRRYDGVDQNRSAELTRKVNETLVPKLEELPGFKGYFLVEAETESSARSVSSRRLSRAWSRRSSSQGGSATRNSTRSSPTSPRSRAARSLLIATAFSLPRSSIAPHSTKGPACRASLVLATTRHSGIVVALRTRSLGRFCLRGAWRRTPRPSDVRPRPGHAR